MIILALAFASVNQASSQQQPPSVISFKVNGSDAQRSTVTSVAIQFSADVGASLQADDLNLVNIASNTPITGHILAYDAATFTGTWTFPSQTGGSVPDGNYTAFIRPPDVVGADSQQLVPNPGATLWFNSFFRYFGDFDGDRDVDFLDTAKFKATQGKKSPDAAYNPAADFNGDLAVQADDLAAFQSNYLTVLSGKTVTPTVVNPPERTSDSTVTLTGTTSPNTRVSISNGFSLFEGLSDAQGNFSITVGLLANRINSLFVGGEGLSAADISSLTPITITQDSTAPFLQIDQPVDGSTLATPLATVTGRVADMLSGFENLSVTVNNVAANITAGIGPNGTFQAPGIPLELGQNVIVVTATDALNNTATRSATVTRIAQSSIEIVSGNDQTAVRNTELPQPVVVLVKDINGQPFPDKIVNFEVKRSDGHLSLTQGVTAADGPMTTQIRTDAQGQAMAYWRLGTDAGNSNNQLVAVSAGLPGEALFLASAINRPPSQINVGMGNNQVGEAGAFAPLPLTAWVSDDLNGVNNVPVTFTVTSGDAKVGGSAQGVGSSAATINTDSTGHVDAYLRLGPTGGQVTVEARFVGCVSNPAVFNATALVRTPGQPASFSAVVEDNSGLAIAGATCTLNVNGIRHAPVASGDNGAFTVPNATPGAGYIQVDGRTATKLNGQAISPGRYPSLVYRVTVVPNADNDLPTTVYLPTLNPVNNRSYDGTQDVDLTVQGVEGLKVKIAAGSMTLADGSRPSLATPVAVSLNQVHADNIPMPIQDGVAPLLTWTLQPPGAKFNPPAAIEYPNLTGLAPGATTNFLSYNHDIERFEIVASATVSADGSIIKSDRGAGLTSSGWGCNCPPYSATGECENPKIEITDPPNNPSPSNGSWQSNFSFLDAEVITARAKLTPAGNESGIRWSITILSPPNAIANPSSGSGAMLKFSVFLDGTKPCVSPSSRPAGSGNRQRGVPISVKLRATYKDSYDEHTITQDERDIIRQEYANHIIRVPSRSELKPFVGTTNFSAGAFNTTPYSVGLGQPSQLAQAVRDRFNSLLATEVGLTTPLNIGIVANSGWRSPEYNESVNGACMSRHQFGDAVDLDLPASIQANGSLIENGVTVSVARLWALLREAGLGAGDVSICEHNSTQVQCSASNVTHVHVQRN